MPQTSGTSCGTPDTHPASAVGDVTAALHAVDGDGRCREFAGPASDGERPGPIRDVLVKHKRNPVVADTIHQRRPPRASTPEHRLIEEPALVRLADWRASLRAWSLAVNDAAGDEQRLRAVAQSPGAVALRAGLSDRDGGRPLAFAHGYLLGCLDAVDSEDDAARLANVPAALPAVAAAARATANGLTDPQLLAKAVAAIAAEHVAHPLESVASLGRLLGALWWPVVSRPAEHTVPLLEALLHGIRAFDARDAAEHAGPALVMTGSGKRRREMPPITTASAVLAAFVLAHDDRDVALVKPVSGGTSFARGSSDAVENLAGRGTAEVVAGRTRLQFVRCEIVLPRFARFYHGLAFAPTVASLCAPAVAAAAACVEPSTVVYGLTDGPLDACAQTLARAYSGARVVAVAGRGPDGSRSPTSRPR